EQRIRTDANQRGEESGERRDLDQENQAVLNHRPHRERGRAQPAEQAAVRARGRRRVVVWGLRRYVRAALVGGRWRDVLAAVRGLVRVLLAQLTTYRYPYPKGPNPAAGRSGGGWSGASPCLAGWTSPGTTSRACRSRRKRPAGAARR